MSTLFENIYKEWKIGESTFDLNILDKHSVRKQSISMLRQVQSQQFQLRVLVDLVILGTASPHQYHLANSVRSQIPTIWIIIKKNQELFKIESRIKNTKIL